jgi:hypothetical protein
MMMLTRCPGTCMCVHPERLLLDRTPNSHGYLMKLALGLNISPMDALYSDHGLKLQLLTFMFALFPKRNVTCECEHYVDARNACVTAGTVSGICCDLSSFSGWGETESTWYVGHCWPIVPAPDDRWWLWNSWWNEDWQGKPKYSQKTCPSATLSTTNPTWPDLGSNPVRRGGKPATNRLSFGTACDLSSYGLVDCTADREAMIVPNRDKHNNIYTHLCTICVPNFVWVATVVITVKLGIGI